MKKLKTSEARFTEMNHEELTNISGGSFAYDLGRLFRFVGIYIYNGGGAMGHCAATLDFAVNMIKNS